MSREKDLHGWWPCKVPSCRPPRSCAGLCCRTTWWRLCALPVDVRPTHARRICVRAAAIRISRASAPSVALMSPDPAVQPAARDVYHHTHPSLPNPPVSLSPLTIYNAMRRCRPTPSVHNAHAFSNPSENSNSRLDRIPASTPSMQCAACLHSRTSTTTVLKSPAQPQRQRHEASHEHHREESSTQPLDNTATIRHVFGQRDATCASPDSNA